MSGVPSWDMFLLLFLIMGIAYGLMLQRDKVVVTMISIYVGLVVTAILFPSVQQFFAGEKAIMNQFFIKSNTNSFTIQTILFLAIIAIVTAKSGLVAHDSEMSPFIIFGFSFLNVALILSSILFFMPDGQREGIIEGSKIARFLVNYRVWWLILPVVLLIFTGWSKSKE